MTEYIGSCRYFKSILLTDMSENGPFISKPARGWLHPDSVLASDGITYAVRVSS